MKSWMACGNVCCVFRALPRAPVIGGMGLVQLDSLDAVEIATAIEQIFEIKAETMPFKNIFRSYNELSGYISAHAPKARIEDFVQKYSI